MVFLHYTVVSFFCLDPNDKKNYILFNPYKLSADQ